MIISPQTGLHENVVVLDYDNQYANLIVSHNLSYETVLSKVEPSNKSNNKEGLLPTIVEKYLKRRLHFENFSKELLKTVKNIFGVNSASIHSRTYLYVFMVQLALFGIDMVTSWYSRRLTGYQEKY
jgi:DNA polymerase elongation subunit (family B)